MDTFTGAKPVEIGSGAATSRGGLVPAGLVGAGISLIVVVGLIHLIGSPEDLEEGPTRGCCTWPTSSARWQRRSVSIGERGGAGPSDSSSP